MGSMIKLRHNNEHRNIRIHANEIEFGPSGKLSRTFEKEDWGIWTAHDKEKVVEEALETASEQHSSIYVGDSSSDLPCLLLADVGICIKDEKLGSEQRSLREALTKLDIPRHWIGEYDSTRIDACARNLWWARDFHDIYNSALLQRRTLNNIGTKRDHCKVFDCEYTPYANGGDCGLPL